MAVDFDYKVYTLFEGIRIKNIDSVELKPTNALLKFPSEFVEVTMASSKEYLDFILEQISELEEITYRAMMGEFILYYRGKIIGSIYDDRLLVNLLNQLFYLCRGRHMNCPMKEQKRCC